MKRILLFSLIFSVLLAILSLLGPGQAKAIEFSSDMVITPKGDEPMKGKIFVKGDKIRQETSKRTGLRS